MKLNCRPGDLAVITHSWAGNEGKIVQCVRLVAGGLGWIEDGPRWEIDRAVPSKNGYPVFSVADCCLRPLRDSDGEDEMLRLVGRPVGTPQAA
jgi:hypothetical protein